jgi:hypothetical protein
MSIDGYHLNFQQNQFPKSTFATIGNIFASIMKLL